MKLSSEILEAALSKEKRAYDFYSSLLLHCKADMVKQLIERLKGEEAKHITMIETMLAQLRLGHSSG